VTLAWSNVQAYRPPRKPRVPGKKRKAAAAAGSKVKKIIKRWDIRHTSSPSLFSLLSSLFLSFSPPWTCSPSFSSNSVELDDDVIEDDEFEAALVAPPLITTSTLFVYSLIN
jgi:hypothetical protein